MTLQEFEKSLTFNTDFNRNDYKINIDVSKKYLYNMIVHNWEHSNIKQVNDFTLEKLKNTSIEDISDDNWSYLYKEFLKFLPDQIYTRADRVLIYNVNNSVDIDVDDCFEIESINFAKQVIVLKHAKG